MWGNFGNLKKNALKLWIKRKSFSFAPTESCYTLDLVIGLVLIPQRSAEETLEGGILYLQLTPTTEKDSLSAEEA